MRYIDVLDNLLHSYNNTFHRTMKMAPSKVNAQNEEEIRARLYRPKSKLFWKFQVGDQVRLHEASVNSRRGTYQVGLTRFSLLNLVDRLIHQYTKFKITTVKSSEETLTRLNCNV